MLRARNRQLPNDLRTDLCSHRFIARGIHGAMIAPLLVAMLALQNAPAPDLAPAPAETAAPFSLDSLPLEQAATARCALAFATVSRWQRIGDARGEAYANIEASGGREFFVRAMARLMDDAGLTREGIMALAASEVNSNSTPQGGERIAGMMPACELMKSAAGL